MSKETIEDLNTLTLIGYTDKRGNAWHYREDAQGDEPNHYAGAIPVEDVHRRLFDWRAVEGTVTATVEFEPELTADGVITREPIITKDPTRKAIVRDDSGALLGIFKSGYKIHQYPDWLVSNVANLLDADLKIGSAGLLKGGAQAWVQIEMGETLGVEANGSTIEFRPFLTAATSMDGSIATTYLTGVQVVVCDNTLSAALNAKNADKIKIRHSANSMSRIGEAREALKIVYSTADTFIEQVETLSQVAVTDAQFEKIIQAYAQPAAVDPSLKSKNMAATKMEELRRLWRTDNRVAPWAGNAYGVLAAINTFEHHSQNVRGSSRVDRNMSRTITGDWDKTDNATLELVSRVLTNA